MLTDNRRNSIMRVGYFERFLVLLIISGSFLPASFAEDGVCRPYGVEAFDIDPAFATIAAGYRLEAWGNVGTLVTPSFPRAACRLRIFFPGHAQELGYAGHVPLDDRRAWAEYLLGPGNYHLGPKIVESGCPVLILGDSSQPLRGTELERLLEKLGITEIEILSHSGGFVGLQTSLSNWPPATVKKIRAIHLLDNFYNENLAETLRQKFDVETLKKICDGFYTAHNQKRFEAYFDSVCPNVLRKDDHKLPVASYF